ncbi:MAG: membrane-spanning protein [Roseburia sp.]
MNCKKYRACLVGVITVALLCGVLVYVKHGKESRVPVDGTLVEHEESVGEELEVWA